jgi:hypothetical protein
MMYRSVIAALIIFALAGCGTDGPIESEDYGNLLASPGTCSISTTIQCSTDSDCPAGETCNGLILVEAEHPTGWTRPECFACHEIRNIHTVNRTGLPDNQADLAGVRAIVSNQGQASCPMCHGTNGVAP